MDRTFHLLKFLDMIFLICFALNHSSFNFATLASFFLNRQNIINQQARARSTNKLGWKKNTMKGKSVATQTPARTKIPLKNHP